MQKAKRITIFIGALLAILSVILFAFLGASDRQSASADFSIKDAFISYDSIEKIITIDEHKVLNVTEIVGITYHREDINVGWVRNISRGNKITRIVDGKKYVTKTINKLELLSVKMDGKLEYNFVETDDDYYYINMGADYDYKYGKHVYEINYLYDMGEDFIDEFDDFTFDLMDYDYLTKIESFSAKVTLPKSFLDGKDIDSVLSFRTNNMKPLGLNAVNANWDEDSLTLSCSFEDVPAQTGITMQLILPEDYFDTNFAPNSIYYVLLGSIIACAIGIALIVCLSRFVKKQIVVPEFYPPKDASAMDVAKAYRGYVKSQDFASLAIDWAAKGFVKIEIISRSHIVLTKLKEMTALDHCEVEYFNSLFKGDKKVYDTKEEKYKHDSGKDSAVKKIYAKEPGVSKKLVLLRSLVSVLASLPLIIMIIWANNIGLGLSSSSFFLMVFPVIAMAVFVYVPMPIWFKIIWCGGFGGAPLGILCSTINCAYDVFHLIWFVLIVFILGFISARFINVFGKESLKIRAHVLGFKKFLVTTELDKLNMLVEADPEYYYNILPYCYIFGITKKMQKKFSALNVKEPKFADGDFATGVAFGYLCHSMTISSSRYSSGGSFHGGGGGGFGGSSGGGGGGRGR